MRKGFILSVVAVCMFISFTSGKCTDDKQNNTTAEQGEYVCIPCGADCDNELHAKPGHCSHCNMDLVKKSTITQTSVQPQDLCSFVTKAGSDNVLLLDVRTPEEFEGKANDKYGRLNHAVNIPIQDLEKRMKELDAWKDRQIVVYCSHSHRSPRASYILTQNGFTKVTNMLGGMSVWKSSVKDETCNQQLFVSQ